MNYIKSDNRWLHNHLAVRMAQPIALRCAGDATRAAAGVPALHSIVSRVLSTVLAHFTATRHVSLLLSVSSLASTTQECACKFDSVCLQ